eukprot:g418.t1
MGKLATSPVVIDAFSSIGFCAPSHFCGMFLTLGNAGGGLLTYKSIIKLLDDTVRRVRTDGTQGGATIELMVHPSGTNDDGVQANTLTAGCGTGPDTFSKSEDRVQEMKVLTSSALRWKLGADFVVKGDTSRTNNALISHSTCFQWETYRNSATIRHRSHRSGDGKLRVLLLAKRRVATGNHTTSNRYRSLLRDKLNCEVFMVDTRNRMLLVDDSKQDEEGFRSFPFSLSLARLLSLLNIDLVIGLHVIHAGKHLVTKECESFMKRNKIPLVMILGGTDILTRVHNDKDKSDDRKRTITQKLMTMSSAVIAFDQSMLSKWKYFQEQRMQSSSTSSSYLPKIFLIPQAVDIVVAENGNGPNSRAWIRAKLGIPETIPLIVQIAGIREVKDPIFALRALERCASSFVYVLLGPSLDQVLTDRLQNIMEELNTGSRSKNGSHSQSFHWLGSVTLPESRAAIGEASVCINTSHSEGMSSAILEAFAGESLMIARSNPGNSALLGASVKCKGEEEYLGGGSEDVSDARGFEFDTEDEMAKLIDYVLTTEEGKNEGARRVQHAKVYIEKNHSTSSERISLDEVLSHAIRSVGKK